MKPAKLRGCPFCGKQPTLYRIIQEYGPEGDDPGGEYESYCMIRCDTECGFEITEEYRSEVIKKWNRRPRTPPPPRERDQGEG